MQRLPCFLGLAFCFLALSVRAQTPLDSLEQELKEVKQQNHDTSTQAFADFISQLGNAAQSPSAALDLYQRAGGAMPDATAVETKYANETPHEREAREARDAANAGDLAFALQLHCGLMRFAGLFISAPDQKGLNDEWLAWLKTVPPVYTQIKPDADNHLLKEIKGKAVKESAIANFLNFHGWSDKEQGQWTVRELPRLYRKAVLDPQRAKPTADTLAAWDSYIAMKNVDEPDNDKWSDVDYPPLALERGCDDYTMAPDTTKLQTLVELLKAHPTHPRLNEMAAQVEDLLKDYKTHHPGSSSTPLAPAPPPPPPDPNVSVSTQGDMTIVTTHSTNAPPAVPPTP